MILDSNYRLGISFDQNLFDHPMQGILQGAERNREISQVTENLFIPHKTISQ